jgi:hypothetical protein
MAKTQSVATSTAHKLKLNESARVAHNAINDHCEFEIGLKRTIGPKAFHQKVTPPCTTHPLLHPLHGIARQESGATRALKVLCAFVCFSLCAVPVATFQ